MEKLKHYHFPKEIIYLCVRWSHRYNLSLRELSEIMVKRGVKVSHETIRNWITKFSVESNNFSNEEQYNRRLSWSMDETRINIRGKMYYYYRAVRNQGNIIEFYLCTTKDKTAAKEFIEKLLQEQTLFRRKITLN